ncbi:unnamed protein product [Pipistrellus nathusii]|uniref:Secreted protein n=1 Tax=Pipistrellus nathusii TaxID=59473 RepID=A0ABP0ACB8_PIPNA
MQWERHLQQLLFIQFVWWRVEGGGEWTASGALNSISKTSEKVRKHLFQHFLSRGATSDLWEPQLTSRVLLWLLCLCQELDFLKIASISGSAMGGGRRADDLPCAYRCAL